MQAGLDIPTTARVFHMTEKQLRNIIKRRKLFNKHKNVDEQDVDASGTGGGGTSVPSQPEHNIWTTGVARGHANPIDQNQKWESGLSRGKSNMLSEGYNYPNVYIGIKQ